MNQEHFNLTYTFATTIGGFFNRDGVPIFMNRWKDDSRIHNSFFVYGEDKNQYFLGEIVFQAGALNFKSFIDGEVIHFLKDKEWI